MNWGDFSTQGIQARLEQAAKIGQNVVSNLAEQAANLPAKGSNSTPKGSNSTPNGGKEETLIDVEEPPSSTSLSFVNISNAELERLRKMENRFVDLARAYKAIKSKQDQIEKIITENSSVKELKLPEHFNDLERLVKTSSQSFDSEREITKLVNQINELKLANEQEASTNADMYSSMQAKLINREEEINRLKHKVNKLEGVGSPLNEGSPSESVDNSTNMDQVTLKLKIRELASALRTVTDQRNAALEKLKGAFSLDSSDSLVEPSKDPKIQNLEEENRNLSHRLETELNASSALKSRLKSLKEEQEKSVGTVTSLQKLKSANEATISELRNQVNSIVEDMVSLSDESDKLKSTVTELTNQLKKAKINHQVSPNSDQMRQDARELSANLEFRLKTVQHKLESLEKIRVDLEKELMDSKAKIQSQEIELIQKNEMQKKIDVYEKKCEELNSTVDSLKASKLESDTKATRMQALADKKSKEFTKLKFEMDGLVNELSESKLQLSETKSRLEKSEKEISILYQKLNDGSLSLAAEKLVTELLKEQLNEESTKLLELNQKLDTMSQKYNSLYSKNTQFESENEIITQRLKTELLEQDSKLLEWKRKVTDLQKLLQTSEALIDEQTATIARLEQTHGDENLSEEIADINALKVEVGSLKRQTERFKSVIFENEKSLANLAVIDNERTQFKRLIHDLEDQISKLKANDLQNKEISEKCELLEAKIKESIVEKNTFELEKQKLTSKISDLMAQIGSVDEFKQSLKVRITEMETEILQLRNDKEMLGKKLIATKEELELARNEIASSDTKNLVSTLENNIENITKSFEQSKRSIETLKTDLASEKERYDSLEIEYTNMKANMNSQSESKSIGVAEEVLCLKEEKETLSKKIADLEQSIVDLQNQVNSTSAKLLEETEKKTKSIQLLRNSKNRILKLESDLRKAEEELSKLATEHQEKRKSLVQAESVVSETLATVTSLKSQAEEYKAKISELQPLALKVDKLNLELLTERQKFADLKTSTDKQIEELQNYQTNHGEQIEKTNIELNDQLLQLTSRLHAADERIEQIDADLLSSKSLFETKCVENDALKLTLSESEVKIFEAGQKISHLGEERITLQEVARQASTRAKEVEENFVKIAKENEELRINLLNSAQICDVKDKENQHLLEELSKIRSAKAAIEDKDNAVLKQAAVDQVKMRELEERLKTLSLEKVDWVHEKDTLLQDFRMREVQLKNLNKALKEEVRKLSKSGSASSSANGSPVLNRSDSMDQSIPIRSSRGSISKFNSLAKMLDPEPEYLKNIVLKFLESNKRSQRVQLVTVLSMLLKFSPEEISRAQKMSF